MKTALLFFYTHFVVYKLTDTAAVKAPIDIISLDDITPLERTHLQYLNSLNEQRKKRSSHGFLSAIGGGLKYIAKASSSGSSHGSGYYDHPPEPEHHDSKSFDFVGLKKSVLNTLLQAAKAIKGAAIALTGKLIKGSGYLVSAKGKLISAKGEAVTDLGKKIASSAVLSPPVDYHHTGYSDHPHEEYHSSYGPPDHHHDAQVSHSAPAVEYDHPPSYPSKYTNYEDGIHHETLRGLPSGIIVLKKIPHHPHEAQESVKIPDFQPLKEREPPEAIPTPMFSSLLTNIFTSSSDTQNSETKNTEQYSNITPNEHTNNDFSSIKPVQEPLISDDKLNPKPNGPYPMKFLQDYSTFPNELIDIPQSDFSDFSTHPGFYINNLAANINTPPNLNTLTNFPTQFPKEFLNPPELPHDPRYLNQLYPSTFHSTQLTNRGPKLNAQNLPILTHNHVKRAPIKSGSIRINSPANYELIKSLSFQLGPRGPMKI